MDVGRIAGLVQEAAELHHRVYRMTDGDDPDWASWYAHWLIECSELPQLLGRRPVPSELIYLLVLLDKEIAAKAPDEPWQQYYAARIVAHFTG